MRKQRPLPPNIAYTIQKKIKRCGVFVAELTDRRYQKLNPFFSMRFVMQNNEPHQVLKSVAEAPNETIFIVVNRGGAGKYFVYPFSQWMNEYAAFVEATPQLPAKQVPREPRHHGERDGRVIELTGCVVAIDSEAVLRAEEYRLVHEKKKEPFSGCFHFTDRWLSSKIFKAGEGVRTLDIHVGKVENPCFSAGNAVL